MSTSDVPKYQLKVIYENDEEVVLLEDVAQDFLRMIKRKLIDKLHDPSGNISFNLQTSKKKFNEALEKIDESKEIDNFIIIHEGTGEYRG